MHLAVHVLYRRRFGYRRPYNGWQVLAVDQMGCIFLHKSQDAPNDGRGRIFSRHWQHAFAANLGLRSGFAQDCVLVLLDKVGLSFLDDQYGSFADAEALHFVIDQRIGDIQDV